MLNHDDVKTWIFPLWSKHQLLKWTLTPRWLKCLYSRAPLSKTKMENKLRPCCLKVVSVPVEVAPSKSCLWAVNVHLGLYRLHIILVVISQRNKMNHIFVALSTFIYFSTKREKRERSEPIMGEN